MSQQLRQLKSRVRSIEGTWKVTRAMEMVSMAKFKGLETPLAMGRAYFKKVSSFFENVASLESSLNSPLMRKKEGPHGFCVIGTDAGLCGIYNERVIRAADRYIKGQKVQPRLYVYGRKTAAHFRREGLTVDYAAPVIHGRLTGNFHEPFLNAIVQDFLQGKIATITILYMQFVNALHCDPIFDAFLPIKKPVSKNNNFIVEFGKQGILADLLPWYLSNRFRLILLEALTSEYSSRMVAMKAAKDNAKELMGDLILHMNKVRQTAITKEVIEIISSVEALKG